MPITESPTQVLVLGSVHLGPSTPDSALESTLRHLQAWQPDLIAAELLPGELVEAYAGWDGLYSDLQVGGFMQARGLMLLAQPHLPLSRAQAYAQAKAGLLRGPEQVLAWLVAGEPLNALLHLTPAMTLPNDIQTELAKFAAWPCETHQVLLPLARALGLRHIAHLDDHTGLHIYKRMKAALDDFWQNPEVKDWVRHRPGAAESAAQYAAFQKQQELWPLLRYLNSPEAVQDSDDLEVGTYLQCPLPTGEHRARIAQWDARNLFMAARLRALTADSVGGKVLFMVGAAHKGPIEKALLALAPDLRLVQFSELES